MSSSLSSHLIQHHEIQTKGHRCWCLECEKSFSKNSQRIKDHRIHSGERPWLFQEMLKCGWHCMNGTERGRVVDRNSNNREQLLPLGSDVGL
ncbi:hypothetical protein DUI87_06151 [Hirundo rustica rustica]|uniref:C2H2-type domain-containing protein n=1 Tax=Hirundo rustica rustica TaxID=333673 RepID=A0A3M0LCQ9_HIRRU|nr:hypothetical protein DUI87_06151 [Hirundo rustica rustica]